MKSSGLKIAFFGSSLVSAYWNGAATYYRGIIRALYNRGHRTTFYEPDAFNRQAHRDIQDPPWARVVVYSGKDEEAALATLEMAQDADLIVKASGVGVFDELLEHEILNLRSDRRLVVFWDVDAPATLDRIRRNPNDTFEPLIPKYDLVLTYGGGEPVICGYAALGARRCVPVYNALDPETHFPVPPRPEFEADLSFAGNRMPDREQRVEDFFFGCTRTLPNSSYMLAGNGWADKPKPPNVRYWGHLYTNDHNAFNVTPLAILNINRESMAQYGFSPPTRIFEAAGAGACIISDSWQGLEIFLDPGKEVLVAGNGEEVAGHLGQLTRAQSRAIGFAARERILAQHTYVHRAAQLESLLGVSNS